MSKINPVAAAIASNARRIIEAEGEKVLERLAPLLSLASDGFEMAADILRNAVVKPGRVRFDLLGKLMNDSPPTAAIRVDAPHSAIDGDIQPTVYEWEGPTAEPDIVLPPYITEREALKRAAQSNLDLIKKTPAEVEEEIFRGMEYARVQLSEGEPFPILDLVRRAMAERMGNLLIDGLSPPDRTSIEIPPQPSSEKYNETLVHVIGFKPEVLEEWQSWPYWKGTLAYQFAGILTMVWRIRNTRDPIDQIENAIEAKRQWYNALAIFDVDDADIEKAIGRIYGGKGFEDLRAIAELRRFVKPNDESLMQNPHSAALLARAITMLHQLDTTIDEDRFMSALPAYAYPMTVEGALVMLRAENTRVDLSMRRRAQAILTWHMHPSQEQVESIESLVRGSGSKFRDLENFCRRMINVGADDLVQKVRSLNEEGLFVEPLVRDILQTFPGETEFRGIMRSTGADDVEADEDKKEAAAAESADAAAEQAAKGAEQLTLGLAVAATTIKPKA
jgi:hypothetical protein